METRNVFAAPAAMAASRLAPENLLVLLLKKLEESDEIVQCDSSSYLTDFENPHPCISDVRKLANIALITREGHCDWPKHDYLKANGFLVTKGEGDSFGWLTGVIHTKKGRIVYG